MSDWYEQTYRFTTDDVRHAVDNWDLTDDECDAIVDKVFDAFDLNEALRNAYEETEE